MMIREQKVKLIEDIEFDDIDEYFSSDVDLSRSLGLTRQTIYYWRKSNLIPRRRQIQIRAEINRRKALKERNCMFTSERQEREAMIAEMEERKRDEFIRMRTYEISESYDNDNVYQLIRSSKAISDDVLEEVLSDIGTDKIIDCFLTEISRLLAMAEFKKLDREKEGEFDEDQLDLYR